MAKTVVDIGVKDDAIDKLINKFIAAHNVWNKLGGVKKFGIQSSLASAAITTGLQAFGTENSKLGKGLLSAAQSAKSYAMMLAPLGPIGASAGAALGALSSGIKSFIQSSKEAAEDLRRQTSENNKMLLTFYDKRYAMEKQSMFNKAGAMETLQSNMESFRHLKRKIWLGEEPSIEEWHNALIWNPEEASRMIQKSISEKPPETGSIWTSKADKERKYNQDPRVKLLNAMRYNEIKDLGRNIWEKSAWQNIASKAYQFAPDLANKNYYDIDKRVKIISEGLAEKGIEASQNEILKAAKETNGFELFKLMNRESNAKTVESALDKIKPNKTLFSDLSTMNTDSLSGMGIGYTGAGVAQRIENILTNILKASQETARSTAATATNGTFATLGA